MTAQLVGHPELLGLGGMVTAQRFMMVVDVHLFLVRDGQLLLLRRMNTGFHDGEYGLVAGHADGGETVARAMIREAREEAGIVVAPEDLRLVQVMHRLEGHERISFFFEATRWQGEPRNTEPHKCDELAWYDLRRLPRPMVPYIAYALERYQEGAVYSEFGWA